jgi:hypothetical protein
LGDQDAARRQWQKALDLLENEPAGHRTPAQTRLPDTLRAKLAALDRSEPPETAPTAAQQEPDR